MRYRKSPGEGGGEVGGGREISLAVVGWFFRSDGQIDQRSEEDQRKSGCIIVLVPFVYTPYNFEIKKNVYLLWVNIALGVARQNTPGSYLSQINRGMLRMQIVQVGIPSV